MRNVVLVTGGRDYTNISFVFHTLDQIHLKTPITRLVQGGATGADSFAKYWAISRAVKWVEHPVVEAEWKKLGKQAGPLRNSPSRRPLLPDDGVDRSAQLARVLDLAYGARGTV